MASTAESSVAQVISRPVGASTNATASGRAAAVVAQQVGDVGPGGVGHGPIVAQPGSLGSVAWHSPGRSTSLRASQVAGEASAAAAEVAPARLVEPDLTGAAFFDVDNTVMRGASIFHLARGLAKRKFFTMREVGDFAWKQAKFVVNGSEDLEDMASATEAGLAFVKGKRVDEVVTSARRSSTSS